MKLKSFTLPLFVVLTFMLTLVAPNRGFTIVPTTTSQALNEPTNCTSTLFAPLEVADLAKMKRKDVEKKLNRKLKLKERLTFRLLKRHAKRMDRIGYTQDDCQALEKRAKNSLLFGLIGLVLAGIILGILAISQGSKAKKLAAANPDCPDAAKLKKRGNTGVILGVIDIIGAIVFIALLI